MTYAHSIRLISIMESLYNLACEAAETDETVGHCLDKFNQAKAEHRAAFGKLRKVNGEWV
jgi:hypothetical protein